MAFGGRAASLSVIFSIAIKDHKIPLGRSEDKLAVRGYLHVSDILGEGGGAIVLLRGTFGDGDVVERCGCVAAKGHSAWLGGQLHTEDAQ